MITRTGQPGSLGVAGRGSLISPGFAGLWGRSASPRRSPATPPILLLACPGVATSPALFFGPCGVLDNLLLQRMLVLCLDADASGVTVPLLRKLILHPEQGISRRQEPSTARPRPRLPTAEQGVFARRRPRSPPLAAAQAKAWDGRCPQAGPRPGRGRAAASYPVPRKVVITGKQPRASCRRARWNPCCAQGIARARARAAGRCAGPTWGPPPPPPASIVPL